MERDAGGGRETGNLFGVALLSTTAAHKNANPFAILWNAECDKNQKIDLRIQKIDRRVPKIDRRVPKIDCRASKIGSSCFQNQ